VDETRDADEASSKTQEIAHGLAISAAATLVAAARYLAPADLAASRDGWLAPRLRAQALVWRSGEDAGAPVCTVREHARVPSGERLPLDTVSALFHADLVLTARVDPKAFKARVTRGQTDLRDRRWTEPVDAEESRRSNATEEAVMATLANALQSCLDVDGIDLEDPRIFWSCGVEKTTKGSSTPRRHPRRRECASVRGFLPSRACSQKTKMRREAWTRARERAW
jgi:hypothetical protein